MMHEILELMQLKSEGRAVLQRMHRRRNALDEEVESESVAPVPRDAGSRVVVDGEELSDHRSRVGGRCKNPALAPPT